MIVFFFFSKFVLLLYDRTNYSPAHVDGPRTYYIGKRTIYLHYVRIHYTYEYSILYHLVMQQVINSFA